MKKKHRQSSGTRIFAFRHATPLREFRCDFNWLRGVRGFWEGREESGKKQLWET